MTQFDLSEVATGVGELYEPLAEEAGFALSIAVEPGLRLTGNRELIGQALSNLVDNALKYGRPDAGSPATVRLSAESQGGEIVLAVADHGSGIPEGDRERVLERFIRLDKSRTQPGFGLGLSLAAAVARLHGGRLRLEDNAPGLRAVMSVPQAPAGAVDSAAQSVDAASTAAQKEAGFQSA
jgi:signal transduction histidine kinase